MERAAATLGKIVDCTLLSSTFPSSIPHEVPRDAVLNIIDDFFMTGTQVVILEGRSDIGKTRVIAQYAMRYPNQAISIFIRPNSAFLQDPHLFLADIANQINWALYRTELADPHSTDEGLVRRL